MQYIIKTIIEQREISFNMCENTTFIHRMNNRIYPKLSYRNNVGTTNSQFSYVTLRKLEFVDT